MNPAFRTLPAPFQIIGYTSVHRELRHDERQQGTIRGGKKRQMTTRDKDIRREIRNKYDLAAESPEELFAYPTGRTGAEGLGYPTELTRSAPDEIADGFCGVGNPFTIAPIEPSEKVLDIGCGAGFDLFCASRKVGSQGLAVGIDITPKMAVRAGRAFLRQGTDNVQVLCGAAEELPVAPGTFDVVISNGALNLSPRKEQAFAEIFQALRHGGRLQFADIILTEELPEEQRSARAWSE